MTPTRQRASRGRRAAVAAFTVLSMGVLIGFVALTVDVGMLYNVRAEMQRCADAGALAGARELMNERRYDPSQMSAVIAAARAKASSVAGRNPIMNRDPSVDVNLINAPAGDVVLGRLNTPSNLSEPLSFPEPARFNTVQVEVHRDATRNGPIDLWFARIWGIGSTGMRAKAAATLEDGVSGFRATEQTGNTSLLPFTLQVDFYNALIAGTYTTGDHFRYSTDTKVVTSGPDDILELNLYPGTGDGGDCAQLPPGNFGTLDIGTPSNSTDDIKRQIVYGVSAGDLSYYGGELRLGADGSINLNGDTGLSGGFEGALKSIIGQTRTIPLFDICWNPGSNAVFHVIGFAGVRIMEVDLNDHADHKKRVVIQPATVIDDSVITDGNRWSKYVYKPIRLTR